MAIQLRAKRAHPKRRLQSSATLRRQLLGKLRAQSRRAYGVHLVGVP
jgi:hypothetical protein